MDLGNLLNGLDLNDFNDVAKLITENKDSLAMLGRLPEYLDKLGDALGGAGEQARSASFALVGEDGRSGARSALASSSEALAGIVSALAAGADKISDAADGVGKLPMMDGPAAKLSGAADEIKGTTSNLGELAKAMDAIGDTLEKVGAALAKLGEHLNDSCTQARGFAQLS